ncbi:MAG TPA: aromatic ring-hydroxylating dioxygenase subunit alpha [Burkholderiales bacterium]|nr:aromatic ring-hydroxylating dioxygenase subunit alpha [Burkholderiales bacterium]
MLTQTQNDELTRTGPGTPMGDLFRRYWVPALHDWELPEPDCPPVRVKLLGEPLVAFRDTLGRIGLVDEFCAHRGVSLWFGRNEECGLRCPYHGWKYDVTGQCVDVPSEGDDGRLRSRIRLKAYPCIERGGVVWAYMGPPVLQPAPPEIEWAMVAPERRYASKRLQECNYLQAMEGGIDSSHVSFLHSSALKRDPLFVGSRGNEYNERDRMPVFEIAEFDGGLLIAARRTADAGRYYWRITPWILPWHTIIPPRAGHPLGAHVWVPIDDEHCWAWSINYHPRRALTDAEVTAMRTGAGIHVTHVPGTFVPTANKSNDYLMDRAAQKSGRAYSGVEGIAMQDASLQESMGPIQDRTRENLCPTDRGIVMARRALLAAAQANRDGRPVPALDPVAQRVRSCAIELPRDQPFVEGARHGLFAPLDTDPVSV